MRELGDKIILNRKHENHFIISFDQFEKSISCQIVGILSKGVYLVRDGHDMEFRIKEEDIKQE